MLFMNCWYNGAFEVCVRWVFAKESAVNGSVYFILDNGVRNRAFIGQLSLLMDPNLGDRQVMYYVFPFCFRVESVLGCLL